MEELEALDTHLQEVRRGTVVLACLQLLQRADYGYKLLENLAGRGFSVDGNTLYPLLRRLEKQGFLSSDWNTDEARPRKFYQTSAAGMLLTEKLTDEWRALSSALASLTGKEF